MADENTNVGRCACGSRSTELMRGHGPGMMDYRWCRTCGGMTPLPGWSDVGTVAEREARVDRVLDQVREHGLQHYVVGWLGGSPVTIEALETAVARVGRCYMCARNIMPVPDDVGGDRICVSCADEIRQRLPAPEAVGVWRVYIAIEASSPNGNPITITVATAAKQAAYVADLHAAAFRQGLESDEAEMPGSVVVYAIDPDAPFDPDAPEETVIWRVAVEVVP